MLAKLGQKAVKLAFRVVRLGVLHGRTGIGQAPSRRERHASCQRCKARDHLAHRRPEHHIEIEVAVARFEAAVRPMIGVDFLAEIEGAEAEVVVEQPHDGRAGSGPDRDVKRDVLIKRVRRFGVVAERIHRSHAEPAAVLVRVAAFLAEPVVTVGRIANERVDKAGIAALETIGLRLPVLQRGLEGRAFVRAEEPGERKGSAANLDFDQRGFNRDAVLHPDDGGNIRARKPGQIEPVAAV